MHGSVNDLDFDEKEGGITSGSVATIDLLDDMAAVITITGQADLDVTVSIDAPVTLDLDDDNKVPVSISYAYSNLGATDETTAKTLAVRVPAGFSSVTLPLVRRSSGPPGPPPTPDHVGYTPPSGTAYIFIFGTLGPVPLNAATGLYSGDINISVEYSTYE